MERYSFEPESVAALVGGLEALDRRNTARRTLGRLGLTYTNRFGDPVTRPEVKVEKDAQATWLRTLSALGLPLDESSAPARRNRGQFTSRARGPRGEGHRSRSKRPATDA